MKALSRRLFVGLAVLAAVTAAGNAPAASARAIAPSPDLTLAFSDPAAALGGTEGSGSQADEANDGGLSKSKALLLSTALPGAGQYYVGKTTRAKIFFVAEAAIWTSFVVFQVQGHLRKDSYIEYAELAAGVDAEDKPEEFYRAMGQYMRSDPGPSSYNEDVRREARALYPYDREAQERYLQENGYVGEDAWEWQSEEDQAHYRSLRRKSLFSFDKATYMLGLAVANRVIAAMDATRSVAQRSDERRQSSGFRLEMRPNPGSPGSVPGMMLCLTRDF
ncbi:MAG: hypothetical protein JW952_05980 [Candidatus Eisenbacteria bacterium]|nr:hypothetical protein [Candidatus Eisenbacteria bacterium]